MSNSYIAEIKNKIKANTWGQDNPNSTEEISNFLEIAFAEFGEKSGFIKVLKLVLQNLSSIDSIKWLNFYSQIRCAYFLHSKGIDITAFEKIKNTKNIDLELNRGIMCEVKSFEAVLTDPGDPLTHVEYVFDNFLINKLIPAFEVQGADLMIMDDIFSDCWKNYHYLNYFLSFIDNPESDRYKIIQDKLGKYLPKILVLSFTKSMAYNPVLRCVGEEWKSLLLHHSDSEVKGI